MTVIKISLEDKGQDFLSLYVDKDTGKVVDAQPFQRDHWRGAIIPITEETMFRVGELCPIHHPPHIVFGFLNYKIEKIEEDKEWRL